MFVKFVSLIVMSSRVDRAKSPEYQGIGTPDNDCWSALET